MKKNKGLIIGIIILIIYGLVMYFVFNKSQSTKPSNNENKNQKIEIKDNYYLVLGDDTVLKYTSKGFINTKKSNIQDLPDLKVFINNKYLGNYKMNYVSTWNLLDSNGKYVSYKGHLIAVSNDFDVVVRNTSFRSMNDEDKKMIFQNYGINSYGNLTNNMVADIDLDKNGEMDEIICLSSMDDRDTKTHYNLLIIKYNNQIETLINEKNEKAKSVYGLESIINVMNSSNDTIVLSKIDNYMGDNEVKSHVVVSYKNDNYVID
jgi:hypothetical protein